MIDIEEERKKFEAWYDAPVPMARSRSGDGYAYAAANNAWKVWQARAALSCEHADALTVAYLSGAADARKKMEREPLTDRQINNLPWLGSFNDESLQKFARQVELAHGIGVKP